MQFTKLRLTGFKSFVDPTDLNISDGLTGIVGPNGCGKSNLLEALRWVMGENRPTAMRGGGMEDVIFAGAASRPARNFAEVALFLDNSQRTAPSGFNDADQIDIVRRITRDVGSAFKSNGKDMRARDIQMLFADASTGAHSPALVRQGQISDLINAKPKSRRRILEEAAGISGLYQRRHEAELKLNGAETNLTRVEDILEQLQTQLTALSRQARQAARYRQIGEELRTAEGLLLYMRWREADKAMARAEHELNLHNLAAAKTQKIALAATRARAGHEEKVPPLREEETIAAAVLQRLLVERDLLDDQEKRATGAIETLSARIQQLDLDIGRENSLNRDAGETIERLTWEKEALRKANEGFEQKQKEAGEAARAAGSRLKEQETLLGQLTEDVARLAARHQSAHRLLADGRMTLAKNEAEAEKALAATQEVEASLSTAAERLESAQHALKQAEKAAAGAEADLSAADAARSEAQSLESDARAEMSEKEGEAGALRAEAAALRRLVDRDRSENGQVLDDLSVDKGYESALGAAMTDDLKSPELSGDRVSGWAGLRAYDSVQPLPAGVDALANHVRAPRVLDRRLSQIGIVAPELGNGLQASLQPGQRLVSLRGDLWRWDGFRAAAKDAPSASALRLQQVNRLAELTETEKEAGAAAQQARSKHEGLAARLSDLSLRDKACRDARRRADEDLTAAARAVSQTEADQSIAKGRLEASRMALARHQEEARSNRGMMQEAEAAVAGLDDLEGERAKTESARATVETARTDMMARRSDAEELRREEQARIKRTQEITKELSGWQHRLSTAAKRTEELAARKATSESDLETARATPGEIAVKRGQLEAALREAEARKANAADALSTGETALRNALGAEREAEKSAGDSREHLARADALAEAAAEQVAEAAARITEVLDQQPATLLETLGIDPDKMPTGDRIEADVARLKRQREAMGSVNLRAEEDANQVRQELETLSAEKADLEAAIVKLRTGISTLNREGRTRLLAAFETVNKNFETLFRHLFGGGEAKLVLVESDDPLEAGLEIMCQPPGKKLSTLSLLSGGEKTLTALALIFAVFLANPAPICVLDEVDAPLDDANVTRLCDLLDEMTRRAETRFMVITHHAVTMARMDRLFGVTMAEQGVSQLVSVDLSRAEQLVA